MNPIMTFLIDVTTFFSIEMLIFLVIHGVAERAFRQFSRNPESHSRRGRGAAA